MKTVIFRDDDISFFTSPEQLEKIYGRLWEANIPVCLAVIPEPRADVRVLHREGQPYDPSIPPQYRGQSKSFPIADNPTICEFLDDKAKAGLVEVCLHGFDHDYYEFELDDTELLEQKITRGLAQLQKAIPNANIRSFIAPYDRLTPTSFKQVMSYEFSICTGTESLKSTPYADMQGYQERSITDKQHLYTCDEYYFTRHLEPELGLSLGQQRLQEEDLIIVVNHYWTFFYDWNGNWDAMLDAWNQYLDLVFELDEVEFRIFGKA